MKKKKIFIILFLLIILLSNVCFATDNLITNNLENSDNTLISYNTYVEEVTLQDIQSSININNFILIIIFLFIFISYVLRLKK